MVVNSILRYFLFYFGLLNLNNYWNLNKWNLIIMNLRINYLSFDLVGLLQKLLM